MSKLRHIGRETPRLIARDVVTGKARYTGDYKLPGMQYGKILRSPHSFARIINIDATKAEALEGVTKVVKWQDVDRDIYVTNGFTPPKHHHIMDEYVRYIGDATALVIAETEQIADEALDLIEVEYEVLEPVFDMHQATKEGAPVLYPEVFPDNVAKHALNLDFQVGDLEAGYEEADAVVEIEGALLSGQNPLPLEPPVIVAEWKGDDVHFIASAAAPAYCHENVAASLNVNYENVRLIAPPVGGSFGSKLYSGNVHCLVFAAVMAKAANCPVRFCYSKEEHFTSHQTRMRTWGKVKFGMTKEGLATAVEVDQIADAGACATTQEFMLAVGTNTLPILCKTNNKRYNGKVVLTNHVPSGSFRGYGYMCSTNLITRAIFKACEELDVDPIDYLEKNAMTLGEEFHNACSRIDHWQTNKTVDWQNLVRETSKAFGWKDRWVGWGKPTWVSDDGTKVRGLGVCAAGHADTGGKTSNANVTITGLGAVYINSVMADFGAGTREVQQKVVAERLNVPLERVRMSDVDTLNSPPDFGSTGSRSTYTGGIAAQHACDDLLERLYQRAEEKVGIPKDKCGFKDGKVFHVDNPEESYPLTPHLMAKVDSITGYGHHPGVDNSTIYHIQCVEVEVDKEMGTFKIIDHFSGGDAGVVINPLAAKNQMQSFFAGIDLACMEETVWDKNDFRVLNPSNIDYKVRTFNDVPPHDHIILESMKDTENDYPFGAVGIGEPVLAPGGPAIRMAIYNACGITLDDYPFTPDKILAELKKKEKEAK